MGLWELFQVGTISAWMFKRNRESGVGMSLWELGISTILAWTWKRNIP